jgi:hypothetical protein
MDIDNAFKPEFFFFKLPIYTKVPLTEKNVKDFESIMKMGRGSFNLTFDGYNPIKKQESTFAGYSPPNEYFVKYGGIDVLKIRCKRNEDNFTYLIYFDNKEMTVMKVGQYPSVADFHTHELSKYNKVLSKEKQKEFSRAIGLIANGVGIGSFVYLRRLFEYLIASTFDEHKAELGLADKDFWTLRMEDKIQTLKNFLPTFLVENKALYSILSLGIHELSEDNCLAYFDTVRLGIEIILDQKLEAIERQEKIKQAQQKISDLNGKLKNKADT